MPTQTENTADRDARLEKLALERDMAVELLREIWESVPATYVNTDPMVIRHAKALNASGKFLESLT